MKKYLKLALTCLLIFIGIQVHAKPRDAVICSYAPSQSKVAAALLGTSAASNLTIASISKTTGLAAIRHSSGAYIFSGSGGYIAGTIGSASVVPWLAGVSIFVGGTAIVIELYCADKNYPELVRQVENAAKQFASDVQKYAVKSGKAVQEFGEGVEPVFKQASAKLGAIANDIRGGTDTLKTRSIVYLRQSETSISKSWELVKSKML